MRIPFFIVPILAVAAVTLTRIPTAAGQTTQVYVQDSPAAVELIAAARDRLGKEEPEEAARLIQQVFDQHGAKLMELRPRGYSEARRVAAGVLTKNPTLLEVYRQLHEPVASQLVEQAGADRELLRDVVERFALTDSGMIAGLRLAGLSLEAGESDAAAVVLRSLSEHPSMAAQRATWLSLSATAELLAGRHESFKRFVSELQAAGGAKAVTQLEGLAQVVHRKAEPPALNPLSPLPAAAPPELVSKEPLWRLRVGGSEAYLAEAYRAEQSQVDELAEEGRFLNMTPIVVDSTLYLNDGRTMVAIEPSSGREVWRNRVISGVSSGLRFAPTRWLPYGMDLNATASGNGRLVGVFGFGAMVTIYPYWQTDSDSQLTCLDQQTGKPIWTVRPDEIDKNLVGAFWYGRPIISGGRVYATARRRQRTQFQDTYIVALELRTGEHVWHRHLASTALTDRHATPSMSHLIIRDGWVYIDSGLGTVAKLSAADGAVEWLTVVPLDEEHRLTKARKPWQSSAPVLVPAGLIVIDDWSGVVRVFGAEDGVAQHAVPLDNWGSPMYLLPIGDDVLTVGERVGRFDGRTLANRWYYDAGGALRGRASLCDERLYLPAGDNIEVIDLAKGRQTSVVSMDLPANLLVVDGQIVAAHRRHLASYSTWDVAARQLEQRIKSQPDDPAPHMSRAWLAYATNRKDMLMESLDRAIELTRDAPADELNGRHRNELFDLLMSMAQVNDDPPDDGTLQQLFNRLALVADNAQQEVAYRLAMARFFERTKRIDEAVEQYQTLLAEPNYRRQLYTHGATARQMRLEVGRRLRVLLDEHGPEAYGPYEAFAAARFEEMQNIADPTPLIDLAEAHPMASVTPRILARAAELTAERGRVREAVSLLHRAGMLTTDKRLLGQLYGRQAELLEKSGHFRLAQRVLNRLAAAHPGVVPERDELPYPVKMWLDDLGEKVTSDGVPSLAMPLSGEPVVLKGRLLSPVSPAPDLPTPPVMLLRLAEELELRSTATLNVIWRRPVGTDEVRLLSIDQKRAWMWYPLASRLQVLSTEDGSLLWEQEGVADRLGAIKEPEFDDRGRPAADRVIIFGGGNVFGRLNRNEEAAADNTLMLSVSDTAVAAADGFGHLVVFDADTGVTRWQEGTLVRQASMLMMDAQHLMIAGTDEDDAPILCVYDAQTGVLLHRLIKPRRQNIIWMGRTDDGLLVYVTTSGADAFDLYRGQTRWLVKLEAQVSPDARPVIDGDRLMLRSGDGDIVWMSLEDGKVLATLPLRGSLPGDLDAKHVSAVGGMWYIAGTQQVVGIGADGVVRWRDAIANAKRVLQQLVTDRYVVVLTAPPEGQFDVAALRRLYVLDRKTGVLLHEHHLLSPEALTRIEVVGGRLTIVGANSTSLLGGAP